MSEDGRRLVNLRDIGGLPLVRGGQTKRGVLYRSDEPYPEDLDPDEVPVWPPALVIDLRREAEIRRAGFNWPATVKHIHHPLHDVGSVDSGMVSRLEDIYTRMLNEAAERMAAVIKMIPAEGGPVLINCVGGKDRTGSVVAVLLTAAGVEREAIVDDYLATGESAERIVQRWALHAQRSGRRQRVAPPDLLRVRREAISIVLDHIDSWPGGPHSWLLDHGADAADIERWRVRIRDEG